MEYKILGFEPKAMFEFFEQISAIPRSSGNEKGVADFLEGFAKMRGLPCYRDAVHNIVIKKAGSSGAEEFPPVMLQGHVDMVCEKETHVVHDFEKDGIKLEVRGDMLYAKGTTLGADNGIAVALMLAVLADDTIRHPPLECVFTVEEETGLTGASVLDGGVLHARTMINLDSEEEGVATVSCAGGSRALMTKEPVWEDCAPFALEVSVSGLLGGHSGVDIGLERANANKLMGRLLYAVLPEVAMNLTAVDGGSKDNAITRDCRATLAFASAADRDRALEILRAAGEEIRTELCAAEPDARVALAPTDVPRRMMSRADTEALVRLLYLAPFGVRKRNVQAGGFIVTSVNLGVVSTREELVSVVFSPRSSVESLQKETKRELALLAELFGMKITFHSEYPGWSYAEHSPIRDTFCAVYRGLFGSELKTESIHAGLECGLFQGKLTGLDAIAVGPSAHSVHTPQEHLDLASCGRFWRLLVGVLEALTGK